MLIYPDVSHHNGEPDGAAKLGNYQFAMLKASEGTGFRDPMYERNRLYCVSSGIRFGAYHVLHGGAALGDAAWAYRIIGAGVPTMIDCEPFPNNPPPDLDDVRGFTAMYRQHGGTVHLLYLPHWYWEQLGRPDLRPLAQMGLHVVSSDYGEEAARVRPYTQTGSGPGWAPYGGVTPAVWQYTDSPIDLNVYPAGLEAFINLINGGSPVALDPVEAKELADIDFKTTVIKPDGSRAPLQVAWRDLATQVAEIRQSVADIKTVSSGASASQMAQALLDAGLASEILAALIAQLPAVKP
jgi:lysozyme